ncbi:hypothetical protein VB773_07920 [Haloarculaceae archaeon H-GB2-1]|nr:hypothetical protein [Haloarculaceae archaeon H-GB1-1]MEA5385995.1 hypothetical protein [Haloarculaceae archaeon H-GB11]MEA5407500.1 hypothetical protein [Haloarculaceae archaeon H-GB2-1]
MGDHAEDRPDYDPEHIDVPTDAPPLRSTAPQSDFTLGQVGVGLLVTIVGLVVTMGLPFVLA